MIQGKKKNKTHGGLSYFLLVQLGMHTIDLTKTDET